MDELGKNSFFDDEGSNLRFEFRKVDKKDAKDLATPPTISDNLTKQDHGSTNQTHAYFSLHNKLLALYKNSVSKNPDFVLDLANSRLKNISVDKNYGFSIAKNGFAIQFFSTEKSTIDNWYKALKEICVLLNFHDEYKAIKMIGRGSFAKVYLVESKHNSSDTYAVKAFTKEGIIISNKSNAKPSMINEIDLMRVLDHENIIKLYEVFETDKSIYLVLELITGKSLQDILKKSTFKQEFSEDKIVTMIRSILDALAYLAAKGIMHRDLKPDNILLGKGNKIKIVDFGLATFIHVPEYIFKKCGTPGYIAPEVFKYDQKQASTFYDDKCDVFSAGAILFYMMFGYPFFEGTNASEILKANRKFTNEYDSMTTITAELKSKSPKINRDALELLQKLLDFDHKHRISAADSLSYKFLEPREEELKSGDYVNSPMIKGKDYGFSRTFSIEKGDKTGNKGERFAEKDSLYLDMGKPDINGRVDTLTSGSQNNSILLMKDGKNQEEKSTGSKSAFGKQAEQSSGSGKKLSSGGAGPSFLKQAIFNNMERNSGKDEESKDDDFKPSSEEDISYENPNISDHFEKLKSDTPEKHPSKFIKGIPSTQPFDPKKK